MFDYMGCVWGEGVVCDLCMCIFVCICHLCMFMGDEVCVHVCVYMMWCCRACYPKGAMIH